MGITESRTTTYSCEQCGKTAVVSESHLAYGWRELRYLGNIARDVTWTEPAVFCSLRCAAAWADLRADREWEPPVRGKGEVSREAVADQKR